LDKFFFCATYISFGEEFNIDAKLDFYIKLENSKDIKPALANKYDSRFRVWGIGWLLERNIPPETANKYTKRFRSRDIVNFQKNNISPETANKYVTSHAYCIDDLVKAKVTPEIVRAYKKRSWYKGSCSIAYLANKGITPEVANAYDKRFDARLVAKAVELGMSSDTANLYEERFDQWALYRLLDKNILPKTANAYHTQFNSLDIVQLHKKGILHKTANKYAEIQEKFKKYGISISIEDIILYTENDVDPKTVAERAKQLAVDNSLRKSFDHH